MIRQELLSATYVFVSWAPGQNQLLQGNLQTPEQFYLGRVNPSKEILVHIIAQDLTYNSSMGRKRIKKHVELAVCIQRITDSVDAAHWLNGFGHSISYDKLNALETRLAEEQVFSKYPALISSAQAYLLLSATIIVIIIWNLFATLLYMG